MSCHMEEISWEEDVIDKEKIKSEIMETQTSA